MANKRNKSDSDQEQQPSPTKKGAFDRNSDKSKNKKTKRN